MNKKIRNDDVVEVTLSGEFYGKLGESQGVQKIKNYFLDVIGKEDIQKEIRMMRKKYKIPKNGFRSPTKYVTAHGLLLLPAQWKYGIENKEKCLEFFLEQKGLYKKLGIPKGNDDILDEYIMFNTVESAFLKGLCIVQDIQQLGKNKKADKEIDESYPVLIRVSPYASLRDVLDFVKVTYTSQIKSRQDKYRNEISRLGKVRSKNPTVRERNALVYKYRDLPYKEILKKLPSDMRDTLDEGSVGKIISDEKKRRN